MAEISDDQLDELGKIADTVENLRFALGMALPPQLHVRAMKEALPEVRDRLRALVVKLGDGENPWELEPDE